MYVLPKLNWQDFTYKTSEVFIDIGTEEAYKKANTYNNVLKN